MSKPSSRLFQSPDKSVILLDIPRSLEESQVPHGHIPTARIVSAPPVTEPFVLPEPRYGDAAARSQAAQVVDLMTEAAVTRALDLVEAQYDGPWCLPRVVRSLLSDDTGVTDPHIPEGARFIQGSLDDTVQELASATALFDAIVLDPPWPNRSARRRSDKYDTVKTLAEMRQLLSHVPVQSHLGPDGIVAVWITNREAVYDFVTSPGGLFSSWGLRLVSEWTWLKVTSSGEPIMPLDSAFRKPWEKLLIAQRVETPSKAALAEPRIIVAVPDVHSRKPNLRAVFDDDGGAGATKFFIFKKENIGQ
ncbi:MT-A70 domain-containing protein [Sarocladium implicatum]|nr:MT-A70 domain-containing protein [Sarocladium implicatum]